MKNTLGDLNAYLFAQLDVITNQDLKGEELKEEINRSKTIASVAKEIISNADTILKAKQWAAEYDEKAPSILEG